MKHSIPTQLLQAIANYLVTKPYSEVAGLIKAIETEAKEIKELPNDEGTSQIYE